MSKSSLRDFEILQQLGKGSFGTVHKVRRRSTQEILVMKQISLKQFGVRGEQEAQNEVNILSSLRHPYVVQYYDSFVENKVLHIVMEFCEKGDLSAVIDSQRRKLMPETKVWKYFIQICLGLEYIHGKNILHRDIKTLNVFLTRDESLRIGDLGVAKKLMGAGAFAHTMVGTPYYLSPELCEEKPYNIKSDIWALGCILYELCTLKHPFEANNQAALFMKIVRAMYTKIPDSFSADMKQIVYGCLSREFRKRPSCEDILRTPGMRDRAMGLNIMIPDSSVLASVSISVPVAPPATGIQMIHRAELPVIFEEAKEAKKPELAKPGVYMSPAYAKEFLKPKPVVPAPPVAAVDIAVKDRIPRSNEKGVKPPTPSVKPAKPVAVPVPVPAKPVAVPVPVPAKPAQINPPATPKFVENSPVLAKPPASNSPMPFKPPVVISPAPFKPPVVNGPSKPCQANSPVPAPPKMPQPCQQIPVKQFMPANPQQRVVKVPPPVSASPAAIPRPVGKGIARPSSAGLYSKQELEDIKLVEDLPKKPSVNDLRQEVKPQKKVETPPKCEPQVSPVASPVIKTNPWKPPISRPTSAYPATPVISTCPESESSEESIDGTETPEYDDPISCDWNQTFSGAPVLLPTYQGDEVSKDSFKVILANNSEELEDDEEEDLENISEPDERHLRMLVKQRKELLESINEKKVEVIRQIGQRAYDSLYQFLKSKVESDELLDMDQEDLNSFMLSNISLEKTQAMGPLYLILDIENRLLHCEENIKAINAFLNP